MLLAVMGPAIPLLWPALVLRDRAFFVGVLFLDGVTGYMARAGVDDPNTEHMLVLFHDLLTTMHTLFMSVTGGLNWQEVHVLLLEISVHLRVGFPPLHPGDVTRRAECCYWFLRHGCSSSGTSGCRYKRCSRRRGRAASTCGI